MKSTNSSLIRLTGFLILFVVVIITIGGIQIQLHHSNRRIFCESVSDTTTATTAITSKPIPLIVDPPAILRKEYIPEKKEIETEVVQLPEEEEEEQDEVDDKLLLNFDPKADLYRSYWLQKTDISKFTKQDLKVLKLTKQSIDQYLALYKHHNQTNYKDVNRVIVLTPDAQLANRLRATVSVIILGILTDSLVSVRFTYYSQLDDLFETRFPVGQDIPTNSLPHVHIEPNNLTCFDFSTFQSGYLPIHSGQYQIPLFFRNPSLKKGFKKKFGLTTNHEGLYHAIFSYLFRPIKLLRDRVKQFQKTSLAGKYVVGVHIRGGGDFRPPLSHENWNRFKTCSSEIVPKDKWENRVYFIAADHQKGRDKAFRIFGEDRCRVVEHGKLGFKNANDTSGVQLAVMDLLLLVFADVRVLTPYSSYSEFTATMAHSRGLYVANDPGASPFPFEKAYATQSFSCLQSLSFEPSFHQLNEVLRATPHGCANVLDEYLIRERR